MNQLRTDRQDNVVVNFLATFDNPATQRKYLGAMRQVIAVASDVPTAEVDNETVYSFPWHEIDPNQLKKLRARLLERFESPSVCFVVVKGLLGTAFDMELIDSDRWMRIGRIKGISAQGKQKVGRRLTDGEIRALAEVCGNDTGPAGARDDAILGIGITQGPRVSEFANFQLEDYDPATGDLEIKKSKGKKSRTIRASNSTKESLDEWIALRGDDPGSLFLPIRKSGAIQYKQTKTTTKLRSDGNEVKEREEVPASMSTVGFSKMIEKRALQAGVKPFAMHDLRRTFITNGWAIGISGVELQTIAGHSSLETTASYDRGDLEDALANTSGRLHYPSKRQTGV